MSSIRILILIALQYNTSMHQMDVKSANSNSIRDREIYVEQPKGFIAKNENSEKLS